MARARCWRALCLTPRLVGERIGLHPLAVIFALAGLWPGVWLCGRAGGAAGQRRAAGGHPAHARPATWPASSTGGQGDPAMKQIALDIGLAHRPHAGAIFSRPQRGGACASPGAVGGRCTKQTATRSGAHLPVGQPGRQRQVAPAQGRARGAATSRAPWSAGWTRQTCWSRPPFNEAWAAVHAGRRAPVHRRPATHGLQLVRQCPDPPALAYWVAGDSAAGRACRCARTCAARLGWGHMFGAQGAERAGAPLGAAPGRR